MELQNTMGNAKLAATNKQATVSPIFTPEVNPTRLSLSEASMTNPKVTIPKSRFFVRAMLNAAQSHPTAERGRR
jgi:hypothetical protein